MASLGEMTVKARMVQQGVIPKFGVFPRAQISQLFILRIKTVDNEIKVKQ